MWKLYTHCSSFTLMVCMACIKSRKNCTIFYRKSFRENICLQKQLLYLCAKTNITSSQRFIMFFLSEEEAVCQWKNWLSFWRNWWNLLRRCQGKPFVAKVQHFHFTKSQIQTGFSDAIKLLLVLNIFFSKINLSRNGTLIRHVAVENCKTIWKLPFVGIWFRKLVETEIYDGALWCDAY